MYLNNSRYSKECIHISFIHLGSYSDKATSLIYLTESHNAREEEEAITNLQLHMPRMFKISSERVPLLQYECNKFETFDSNTTE